MHLEFGPFFRLTVGQAVVLLGWAGFAAGERGRLVVDESRAGMARRGGGFAVA